MKIYSKRFWDGKKYNKKNVIISKKDQKKIIKHLQF